MNGLKQKLFVKICLTCIEQDLGFQAFPGSYIYIYTQFFMDDPNLQTNISKSVRETGRIKFLNPILKNPFTGLKTLFVLASSYFLLFFLICYMNPGSEPVLLDLEKLFLLSDPVENHHFSGKMWKNKI